VVETEREQAGAIAWPLERRLVVLGSRLVVPLDASGPRPELPAIRSTGGADVPAKLWRLGVSAAEPLGGRGGVAGAWMGPGGAWSSRDDEGASRALSVGVWVVVLDVSAVPRGEGLLWGPRAVPLDWVEADEELGRRVLSRATGVVELDRDRAELLAELVEPVRQSPMERWRAEAILDATRLAGAATGDASMAPGVVRVRRAGDEVVDLLAEQTRRRWHAALGRLAQVDAGLAIRLAQRLTGLVRFPPIGDPAGAAPGRSVVAPAWPRDERSSLDLVQELLDPRVDAQGVALRAGAFAAALTPAVAWVIDDAGQREGLLGRAVSLIGAANLGDAPVAASAQGPEESAGPGAGLLTLPPGSAGVIDAPTPAQLRDGGESLATVRVRVGEASLARRVASRTVPVRPPGLSTGAFAPDWTNDTWLRAAGEAPAQPEARAEVAAMVLRRGSGAEASWTLFVEARADEPRAGEPIGGGVRLWAGPFGRANSVLAVLPDGRVFDQTRAARAGSVPSKPEGEPTGRVEVVQNEGRWMAWIPLPSSAIEPDGTLRLGIERTDDRGRRWAWPRAMLPWQVEPGRAALNTGAWGQPGR
jgi:hypothetical protein